MAPPDLSLIARSKGPDYVYTFLRSFYADPTKATGVNNLALPGTAMPHVLWELQGMQEAVWEGHTDAQGNVQKHFKEFKLARARQDGRPSSTTRSCATPSTSSTTSASRCRRRRQALGYVVIAFLVFFTLLAYALKKEYWKDVK